MSHWGRTLRTASHLRLGQLVHRLPHELRVRARDRLGPTPLDPYRPDPTARLAIDPLAPPPPEACAELIEAAWLWQSGRVRIHGLDRSREDWTNAEMTRLWRYERQYHRELLALAVASLHPELIEGHPELVEGRDEWIELAVGLIESWLASCPPFRGDAWEPYPVARRTLNWAHALALVPELAPRLSPHLAGHVRLLERSLERHLEGNHLLCDAAALVAGSAILDGEGMDASWLRGCELLTSLMADQVLPDGGYAERTVQYHAIALADAALALRLSQRRGRDPGSAVTDAVDRMVAWLSDVGATGRLPWLNDAAPQAAPSLPWIAAMVPPLREAQPGDLELPDTGWSFIREGAHELLFEHGPIGPPHQPGHGHSDALSLELVWDGVPVVLDSGTTTYLEGEVRDFERSARAHACVTVDGQGPDELWRSFRVGGRAHTSAEAPRRRASGIRGCRGQCRAFQGWTHLRGLLYWPGVALAVFDRVQGASQRVVGHWPFAPGWALSSLNVDGLRLQHPSVALVLDVHQGRLVSSASGETSPRDGWIGHGFEHPVARTSIAVESDLSHRIALSLHPPDVSVALRGGMVEISGPAGRDVVALDDLGLPA